MVLDVYIFEGSKPGTTGFIMGGMHGDALVSVLNVGPCLVCVPSEQSVTTKEAA